MRYIFNRKVTEHQNSSEKGYQSHVLVCQAICKHITEIHMCFAASNVRGLGFEKKKKYPWPCWCWSCITLYLHDSVVGRWCYKLVLSSQWGM